MFSKKEKPKYQLMLERELESAIGELRSHSTGSEEHKRIMNSIVILHELMEKEPSGVSKDVLATIGGNLFGILMILKHERVNVITSKALSFVIRTRT